MEPIKDPDGHIEEVTGQEGRERAEKIDLLVREIFDERREAFIELAKGPSPNESPFETKMNELMERRKTLFEKLAEDPK